MRIHSSSLTLTPSSFNQQQVGKQGSAQNKNEIKEPLFTNGSHDNHPPFFPSYSPEEIRQTLAVAGLNITTIDKENTVPPRDTRILRALTAYNQELNKPFLAQRARVTPGIDIYA
jgi:hypothetical protein